MSDVVPDGSGKYLKVKFIQRKDNKMMAPAYLMDEGSAVSWTPNAAKLASEVGVKLANYDEDWYGSPVSVVEMDGAVDKLEEIIYLESQLCNTGTKVRPPLLHLPTSRRRGVPSRGPCMRAAREPTLMCPLAAPPLARAVLRRADRADHQEQGLARLGQRHRPDADAVLVQDPRGVREAHRVNRP